jgi:GalNAc-alpha-(1->4)-GalNAc-alpha-(1->3)-diNAcBac-PP-undecaprenol alpha-1,4-N-acetyl-D-galactosaminyltransferase
LPGVVSDISSVLQQADLFVFPSRYEGFPNALCEAMAMGLPVIASSCSGSRDVVRDGVDGRLFAVGDVAELTAIASELISDFEQRQRLAAAACKISERFDQQQIYALWDQHIEKAGRICVSH